MALRISNLRRLSSSPCTLPLLAFRSSLRFARSRGGSSTSPSITSISLSNTRRGTFFRSFKLRLAWRSSYVSSTRLRGKLISFLSFTHSCVLSCLADSQASYMEGWFQSGTSMRLASACQLNKISTSSFDVYSSRFATWPTLSFSLKRIPFTRLAPPRDGIELGERIIAFWNAYSESRRLDLGFDLRADFTFNLVPVFDRISSTGPGWAEGIPDLEIETPWPRSLEEYEKVRSDLESNVSRPRRASLTALFRSFSL